MFLSEYYQYESILFHIRYYKVYFTSCFVASCSSSDFSYNRNRSLHSSCKIQRWRRADQVSQGARLDSSIVFAGGGIQCGLALAA